MSVRPSVKRNRINTFMIRLAKDYFKTDKVEFDKPTKEGKIFKEAKTYFEGGDFKPKFKVSYGSGGIIVYHGSINSFDKFSLDRVGEGRTMKLSRSDFGWGVYFSSNKESIDPYTYTYVKNNSLDFSNNYWKKKRIDLVRKGMPDKDAVFMHIASERLLENYHYNINKTINKIKDDSYVNDMRWHNSELSEKQKHEIIKYIELLDKETLGNKVIYTVSLFKGKNKSEYDLLNFSDKPTKKQLEKISGQLEKEKININIKNKTTEEIQGYIEDYYRGKNHIDDSRQASLFFLRSGIDGLFEDNLYVIWNDDVIEIEDKKVFGKGGEMPHHYIKVTKDGDYIGAIKFNPNNPERVTNLADLASTAKRAGYNLTPIDVETYRSLIKNIDYEKLKKYQEDMWLADKENSGVHDSSFNSGGDIKN